MPSQSESAQLAMPAKRSYVFQPTTPAQMLDISQFYTYELLPSTA
jgi:hypothetical protein